MVNKETEHPSQELKDTRKICLELEEALATEMAESEKQAEQMQSWNRQLHEKTLALEKSLIGQRATSSSLDRERERSTMLAAELVTVRSKSQATISEREERICRLTSTLDQEVRARATLQASLDQEQLISIKLRMRTNKVASDLKRDLTTALSQQNKAAWRHSQQLQESLQSQKREKEYLSVQLELLRREHAEVLQKVREQTLSLERSQAARLNERLLAQAAEDKTLSFPTGCRQEETTVKESLLASLTQSAEQLNLKLIEEQDKSIMLQRQVQAALSDKKKMMEERDALAQESQQQKESLQRETAENKSLSSQMELLLEETSAKDTLLALLDSEAERVTSELIEHQKKNVRLQGELQAVVSENENNKNELAEAETTAKTASEQLKALKEQLSEKALALEKSQAAQRDLCNISKITQKSWKERVEKLQLRSTETSSQTVQTQALSSGGQAHSLEDPVVLDRNQKLEKQNAELLTNHDSRMSKHQRVLLSKHNLLLTDHSSSLQKDHDTLREDYRLLQAELDGALADIAYFESSNQTLKMNCRNLEAHQHPLQETSNTLLAKNQIEKLSLLKHHHAMKDHWTIQSLSILKDLKNQC